MSPRSLLEDKTTNYSKQIARPCTGVVNLGSNYCNYVTKYVQLANGQYLSLRKQAIISQQLQVHHEYVCLLLGKLML